MASEDEARGVGLNWASEGLGFVHISVVDFAWKLVLVLVLVGESMSMAMAETEAEREVEMEEHRERGHEWGQEREEDEVGELEDEVWRPMRGKERRVVRRREDEQEE